jgi:hypothetical protein
MTKTMARYHAHSTGSMRYVSTARDTFAWKTPSATH